MELLFCIQLRMNSVNTNHCAMESNTIVRTDGYVGLATGRHRPREYNLREKKLQRIRNFLFLMLRTNAHIILIARLMC